MTLWQDRDFEVGAEVVPRYFWTTVSIDVYLDGLCILRTGGVWRFWGTNRAIFEQNGEDHVLELAWQADLFGFPYQLSVDGQLIECSRARPRNWLVMSAIPGMTLLALATAYLALKPYF